MIGSELTVQADAAAARYVGLVAAWRGIYSQALSGGDFATAKAYRALKNQSYTVARSYLNAEKTTLLMAFEKIAQRACESACLFDPDVSTADSNRARTRELVSAFFEHALTEITIQIERDIAFMGQRLRQAALAADIAAQSQNISRKAAQIEYRLNGGSELRFHFRDRQGRRWPSQKFVRTTVRAALLEVYNQVVLETLSEQRLERAIIRHPDQGSRWNGFEISLIPQMDHPTYDEIRDEVFHPNSEAFLTRPEAA